MKTDINIKKLSICILAMVLSFIYNPSTLRAGPGPVNTERASESRQAQALVHRLEQIKAMDPSQMSATEKRAIRKEVRAIRTELQAIRGGIYISAGALIVILILLIIFI